MKLKHEKLGDKPAYFGRGMNFQHRGVQYLLIAPSDEALTEVWMDIHPNVKAINLEQVKDVGVMAESVIRSQFNGSGEPRG